MTKNKTAVSIVIPTYDGIELLRKNLPAVIDAQKSLDGESEIIVVDDYSADTTVDFLNRQYPDVKIVRHKKHRGFPAAVNTGARTSHGKFLVLLNNDVSPSKDFLLDSLPHFSDKNVFAVSFNEKKYSWTKGRFISGFIGFKPGATRKSTVDTFWANGGSAVFRRDYWMKLGGFDEILYSPFYWEDIDLSYRAQKRGWKILWEPQSKVDHNHESTTGKYPKKYRQRIQERNQLLFIWKNLGSPILIKKHIMGLLKRIFRHPGYSIIFLMALVKIKDVFPLRKKEKKECKISDEAIFQRFA